MLAKLSRVLLIADEIGGINPKLLLKGLNVLRHGVEVWLNGSAQSPFLYDEAWGGIVTCGCDYDGKNSGCYNRYPNCPALIDAGQNFGAGFYNDHHYHYGYHIYAAAVLSKFDYVWARKFHQHVLLLVRDIANPSDDDPYFTTWRHKDWYLGFSWASGIVTIQGRPYPNGRNQESSSEAIAAYEAIALYGDVMATVFRGSANIDDSALKETALRIRDIGRLLQATETRSARIYWHVQSPDAVGVSRIYPGF
jgi:endo-1,3(4)-beta-glucanase